LYKIEFARILCNEKSSMIENARAVFSWSCERW